MLLRSLYGFIVRRPWVRKLVTTLPFTRNFAWRFVAGETLETGLAALRKLNARGIHGTLNYVGTHVMNPPEAVAAATAAVAALQFISEGGIDSHLSIKLTQIGLDIDYDFCRTQLQKILETAKTVGNFVRIDMEESRYVDKTLKIFEEARENYGAGTVGIAIQSYLRGHSGDLDRVLAGGSRVRLVKGGYWESPEVVFKTPEEIDQCFERDLETLLARGRQPAIATHDVHFVARVQALAEQFGLQRSDFEFQMLYGVRPDLQERLVREGFHVRCYVPYGGQWYAYFMGCFRRWARSLLGRDPESIEGRPAMAGNASAGFRAKSEV